MNTMQFFIWLHLATLCFLRLSALAQTNKKSFTTPHSPKNNDFTLAPFDEVVLSHQKIQRLYIANANIIHVRITGSLCGPRLEFDFFELTVPKDVQLVVLGATYVPSSRIIRVESLRDVLGDTLNMLIFKISPGTEFPFIVKITDDETGEYGEESCGYKLPYPRKPTTNIRAYNPILVYYFTNNDNPLSPYKIKLVRKGNKYVGKLDVTITIKRRLSEPVFFSVKTVAELDFYFTSKINGTHIKYYVINDETDSLSCSERLPNTPPTEEYKIRENYKPLDSTFEKFHCEEDIAINATKTLRLTADITADCKLEEDAYLGVILYGTFIETFDGHNPWANKFEFEHVEQGVAEPNGPSQSQIIRAAAGASDGFSNLDDSSSSAAAAYEEGLSE